MLDKIELARVKKAQLPKLVLGKKAWEEVGRVVQAGIVLNVKTSRQANGSPIKRNTLKTQHRKRRLRRLWKGGPAPLIDEKHRFIQPGQGGYKYTTTKHSVVIKPGTLELTKLAKWNQRRGYTGWFGLSKRVKNLVQKVVKKHLLLMIKRQASRRGPGMGWKR